MTSRALREAKEQLRKQVVPVLDQARRPLLTARVLERITAGAAPGADIVNEPICRNLLVLNERGDFQRIGGDRRVQWHSAAADPGGC